MYIPKYSLNNKIVNELVLLGELRSLIYNFPVILKREKRLHIDAVMHNTHSSTSIEGNPLSLEQVIDIVEGKKIIGTKKDRLEVINYANTLDKIPDYGKGGIITEEIILDIQKNITTGTLKNESFCGAYRDRQVFIGRKVINGTQIKEEVVYMPPDTKDVPHLMDQLIEWIDSEDAKLVNPVLQAGIVHYEFVRIHPFVDGNGRTSRVLASLILYIREFDRKQILPLDDYYWRDREAYYNALNTVHKMGEDLTTWLEYYSSGVRVILEELRDRIARIDISPQIQVVLSDRQIKILEYVTKYGRISNKIVRGLFNISHEMAHRELKYLVSKGLLNEEGEGRSLHYLKG